MSKENGYLSITSIAMIVIIVSVVIASTLTEFRKIGIAQGQENLTSSSSSITPEQKATICSSVGSHVNTRESKICGIPATPSSNATLSENATTGSGIPSSYEGE